jgi:signal transduction histidine kinase
VSLEYSLEDRAWPTWLWSPQDRSIVAANMSARALWKLAPKTTLSGFLFPAKGKVTRRLHGAAIALLAGADQVQVDIKLPFAKAETWQCRRLKSVNFPDGLLLLEAPQHVTDVTPGQQAIRELADRHGKDNLWQDDAFNSLAIPVIMIAADGNILHLNQEAQRLAPSDLMTEIVGDLWSRPTQFRNFFTTEDDVAYAIDALAEAHRTGSASFIASLKGVPGFPGGRAQILVQRIGQNYSQSPLMVTFQKLARSEAGEEKITNATSRSHDVIQHEIIRLGAMAFELSADNRIVFFSSSFATWLGRPPQDIGGRKISEVGLTPDTGAAMRRLSNNGWQDGRFIIRRGDGTISTIRVSSIVLETAAMARDMRSDPVVVRRLCIARVLDDNASKEVSAQTSAQAPLAPPILHAEPFNPEKTGEGETLGDADNLIRLDDWREGEEIVLTGGSFQALIETLDAPLLGLDETGGIKFLNPAAQDLLGVNANEAAGAPLKDFFVDDDADQIGVFLDLPRSADRTEFGKTLALKSSAKKSLGSPEPETIRLKLHALRERSPIRFCAFLRSNKEADTKSVDSNIPGAKPKEAKNTSPNSTRKADFVARVSHEIRTPLNAILGFSDLILSESMGPIGNEKYKEYMKDIKDSGHLILSLVNDILDLAKVEAEGLNVDIKGMSMEDSMRQAVSMLSAQSEARGIDLLVNIAHPLPIILADERSVMQILLNLISNAIKFTSPGGQVRVSAKPSGKDHVSLTIQDTGVGMSDEDLKKALAPYRQTDANELIEDDGNLKGTGLGLPISKALAEANKAKFRIVSARNSGTRVEILFNRARIAAE